MRKAIIFTLVFGLIFWVILLFYFSTRPPLVSDKQAKWLYRALKTLDERLDFSRTKLFEKVREFFTQVWFKGRKVNSVEFLRKSAHFGLYLCLGAIAFFLFLAYTRKLPAAVLTGISLPALVGVFDEYAQSFVGRGSRLEDVIVDVSGAVTGVLFSLIFFLLYKVFERVRRRWSRERGPVHR